MKLRVGALALDRARIENLIANPKQRNIGTDGIHDTGSVEAQDFCLALGRRGALADLVIDRVCGNRLHGDADVANPGLRFSSLEIDQRVCIVNGKRLLVSDGFHARCLQVWCNPLWRNCRSSAILARASPLSFLEEPEQPWLLRSGTASSPRTPPGFASQTHRTSRPHRRYW